MDVQQVGEDDGIDFGGETGCGMRVCWELAMYVVGLTGAWLVLVLFLHMLRRCLTTVLLRVARAICVIRVIRVIRCGDQSGSGGTRNRWNCLHDQRWASGRAHG